LKTPLRNNISNEILWLIQGFNEDHVYEVLFGFIQI